MERTGYLPEHMKTTTATGELLHLDRTDLSGMGADYYSTVTFVPYPGPDPRVVTFTVSETSA